VDVTESRSEIPGKFRNVLLEKDGEISWTDHVRNVKRYIQSRRKEVSYLQQTEGRINGLVTAGVGTAF
jgi:hypothetical protein